MANTRKVIDVHDGAIHYECIRDYQKNLYKIIWVTNSDKKGNWTGTQRLPLNSFRTLYDAMYYLTEEVEDDLKMMQEFELGGEI